MIYEELYLKYGGGIRPEGTMTPSGNHASLIIGIGGTGIAALAAVRGKIKTRMRTDTDIPILAIDTDPADFRQQRRPWISDAEFLYLTPLHPAAPPAHTMPGMDWLALADKGHLMNPVGASAIRQAGRFRLLSHVDEVTYRLQQACLRAVNARNTWVLDIYLCAGLSGGTGSGCYMDVCYLLRQLAWALNLQVRICGIFFLPDVAVSKLGPHPSAAFVETLYANGYAALKELDYHMDLPGANGRFRQTYGRLTVDTQEPPVDYCHLISAIRADGSVIPNGYWYATDLAAEYIFARLTGFTPPAPAGQKYSALGISRAEIPVDQINTYLACGFYKKFLATGAGKQCEISQQDITCFMQELRLHPEDVYKNLTWNLPELSLPDIAPAAVLGGPMPAHGHLFREWENAGNAWLGSCNATAQANFQAITRPMSGCNYSSANPATFMGRLFRKLLDIATNPAYGPYYAIRLLRDHDGDLLLELDRAMKTARERISACQLRLDDAERAMEEAKNAFLGAGIFQRRRRLEILKETATDRFRAIGVRQQLVCTADALAVMQRQAAGLYDAFFRPLEEQLDNLHETFRENSRWLEEAELNAPCITLDDVKPILDRILEQLTPKQLITDFVGGLLECSHEPESVSAHVNRWMLEVFRDVSGKSLQDWLYEKYAHIQGNLPALAECIQVFLLHPLASLCIPAFHTAPEFIQFQPTPGGCLRLDMNLPALSMAANNYCIPHPNWSLQTVPDPRGITALQCCGIHLAAYAPLRHMQDCYNGVANTCTGVGIHLYSYTGRGTCADPSRDWLHSLPDLLPPVI